MLNSNTKSNFRTFTFDPKESGCIQHLKSHLKSSLNSKVTQRDNTGVIANAILDGQTTTNESNGMLVKYTLEMSKFDTIVETQFKEKIESSLNEGNHDDVSITSKTTWSTDKTKLFVVTQFASSNETAFNQITKNANDIKELDFHHVVLNDVEEVSKYGITRYRTQKYGQKLSNFTCFLDIFS